MITLADATRFSEESPAIRNFKPWWEIIVDYMLLALLLISLLAWARVTSVEASGLICVPLNSNISYAYVEYRYADSRCSQEFETNLLLYYPYLLFLQWLITFLIQRAWLKVPVVMTKLDAFHNIFCEMCSITPSFHRNKQSFRMLPEIVYEDESYDQVKVVHDRLMFLLTEKSYLMRIYRAKVFILLTFSFIFATGVVYWLCQIQYPKADIPCNLSGGANAREFKNLICNFSSAFFLYGVMWFNGFVLWLTMMFSCHALHWTFKQKSFADNTGIFGQMIDLYTGLPGFNDLQFCMSLVRSNVRDGNITFEVIKSCLSQEARQLEAKQRSKSKVEVTQRSRDFEQEHAIVRLILQELGLEIIENKQDANHLFECIDKIRRSLSQVQLDICCDIRERLAKEIQRNPMHFKSMIDNDPQQLSYDRYIEEMRQPCVFGNQYAVAAAANTFNVRIVIVHCQNTSENREVFEPFTGDLPRGTRFLAFTGRHYYHATKEIHRAGEEFQKSLRARVRFADDEKYRNAIRQSASRSIERSEEGELDNPRISICKKPSLASATSIRLLDMPNYDAGTSINEVNVLRRFRRKLGMMNVEDPADFV